MPSRPMICVCVPLFFKFFVNIQAFGNSGVPAIHENVPCVEASIFKGNLNVCKSPCAAKNCNYSAGLADTHQLCGPLFTPVDILSHVFTVALIPARISNS